MNLTDKNVKAAKPDASKRREIADSILPGLYLVVQPSGVKSWAVRYRHMGRSIKLTLPGRYPAIGLAAARAAARDALSEVSHGRDPSQKNATSDDASTVEGAVAEYIRIKLPTLRPGTQRHNRREVLALAKAMGRRPIREVTRRDVLLFIEAKVVDENGAGTFARKNRAKIIVSFFGWAQFRGLIDVNVADNLTKGMDGDRMRQRFLNDDEIAAVWRAAPAMGDKVGDLVKLLLLTGARREEIAALRWSEVGDREIIILGDERAAVDGRTRGTKTYEDLRLPITPAIAAILDSWKRRTGNQTYVWGQYPISNGGVVNKAVKVDGVPHFVLHDTRRSVETGMSRIGVDPSISHMATNHVVGTRTKRTYDLMLNPNTPEVRAKIDEAFVRWSEHVAGLAA